VQLVVLATQFHRAANGGRIDEGRSASSGETSRTNGAP
jgi:hypothetical protein